MNVFDMAAYAVGSFIIFVIASASLLFILAWLSDKWDNRNSPSCEDEHMMDLPAPWDKRKR